MRHVERARSGPFGGTIAHGYLTLALLIPMWTEVLRIEGIGMAVNYGLNKVRFPAPVPVGAKIRLRARVDAVREVPADSGPQVRANWSFEVTDKMALVKAVAAGTVSHEAVEPNETYLRKRAQADKSTCQIPGVRVWDAGTVVQRRTAKR